MKIAVIRGCNLASLAGHFEINLQQEPLASCGLFAITGPTGSGKSTLLDTLCLALFNNIPRMQTTKRNVLLSQAGEDPKNSLRSTDVRSIVRREAKLAYAEVEFFDITGGKYQARWEVQRARTGKLGIPQLSLFDFNAQTHISGTNKEVLKHIGQRLGLGFEQFCRSALLAQGDFAAFLKAGTNERGDLLERMTGTAIYSRLSMQAFERCKQEKEKLAQLESRLGALQPLNEENLHQLQQQKQSLQEDLRNTGQQQRQLEEIKLWYSRFEQLEALSKEAEQYLRQAQQAYDASAPRRAGVEAAQRIMPLRHLFAQQQEIQRLQREYSQQAKQCRENEAHCTDKLKQAQQAQQNAIQLRQAAEQALQAARPILLQARRLDTELTQIRKQLAGLKEKLLPAQQRGHRLEAERKDLQEALHTALTQQKELTQKLAEHAGLQDLAKQWPRWDAELQRYRQTWNNAQQCQNQLEIMQNEGNDRHTQCEQLAATSKRLDQALQQAVGEQQRLHQEETRYQREALQQKENSLQQQLQILQAAVQHQSEWTGLRQILEEQREALQNYRGEIQQASTDEARLNNILDKTRERLEEARRALDLVKLSHGATPQQMRSALQENQPCPVCGSLQHPWSGEKAPPVSLLHEQEQRVSVLQQQLTDTSRHAGENNRRLTTAIEQEALSIRRIKELEEKIGELIRQWPSLCPPDWQPPLEDPATLSRLQQMQEQAAAQLAQVQETLRAAGHCASQLQEIQQICIDLQAQKQQEDKQLEELQRTILQFQNTQHNKQQELENEQRFMREIEKSLRPVCQTLPDWEQRLCNDAEKFRHECENQVHDYLAWQNFAQSNEQARQKLENNLEQQNALLHDVSQQVRNLDRECAELEQQIETLAGERLNYFTGATADEAEQSLEDSLQQARNTETEANQVVQTREHRQIKARQENLHLQTKLEETETALATATQALQQGLLKNGLSLEQAELYLNRDEQWLAKEQKALQKIQETLHSSRVLEEERQRRLNAHKNTGTPQISLLQAQMETAETIKKQELTQTRLAECEAFLREDARKQGETRILNENIEKQKATSTIWINLNELIGSANGDKFRRFAQSLSLDHLLEQTNRHLQDLNPRYYLQRVPGTELDLQVADRDMGDEIRSINSLSGGETFLVSLALALGLSSLSANRTKIETLFIDEGFGSLDADTLDIALAGLDRLQAGGCQVGVISHVSALVESIAVQIKVESHGGGRSTVKVPENPNLSYHGGDN